MSKKVISVVLVLITLLSVWTITAGAASYTNAFDVPTSSKYAKVYTLSTSGKTIPYTSKYLSQRGTTSGASNSSYIANSSDELYLMNVGTTNGKTWAYVSYPTSSGRKNAYIYLSAISSASYGTKQLYYSSASGKFYCAPRKGSSTSSSYYVDKGDNVYVLTASTSSGASCQIMYPTSGNKWRIAWCTYNDARKYLDNVSPSASTSSSKSYTGYVNTSSAPLVLRKSASTSATALVNMPKGSQLTVLDNKAKTNGFYHVKYNGTTGYASASYITFTKPSTNTSSAGSFQWPMSGYVVTQSFNNYSKSMANSKGRPYHCGVDMSSSNTTICAAANGTVKYKGYSSGNGYHIVIEHKFNGQTVYTLYSHLSSYSNCPSVGNPVNKGAKIGVMGNTGNSTGPHLHFAIFKGYSNDPIGYTINSGSNKITYGSQTFYNPSYVIQYNKLP